MLVETDRNIFFKIPLRKYQSSNHLDFLRSVAALEVFFSHSRTIFFADYSNISNPNPFIKAFYFLTGLGHESVIIFFVLSGFFISSSVLKANLNNKWSWKQYSISRLSRLYIVFVPALILGYFWDTLGVSIFGLGADSLYGEKLLGTSRLTFRISERLGLDHFLGNLFFLDGIVVKSFGSNYSIWSLACEFWYYVLFPLIFIGLFRSSSVRQRILYLGISILILIAIGSKIRTYFPIWLLGTALCLLQPKKLFNVPAISLSCTGLIVCLTVARFNLVDDLSADFIVAIASSCLIYTLLNDFRLPGSGIYENFSREMAGFSYSLYLLHAPPLAFARTCLMSEAPWQPNLLNLTLWLLICIAVLIYSYLISLLTEAKTEQLRYTLLTWLGSR